MATTTTVSVPASIKAVYSKEIIRQAQPMMRFAQFAKRRTDLEKGPGGGIKFTKYNSIKRGGKLTEGVNINAKAMSSSEMTITVEEYGNAVEVTEKLLQLSMRDELQEAAIQLANDMAAVLDKALMDVALSTSNNVYGNGKTSAAALAVGDGLTTKTIKDVAEALSTNNSPKIAGQYYVCIAHPHQLRQLRDDPNWINAHSYVGVEMIYYGEVGMYEGVRFVETTNLPANKASESLSKYNVNIPTWEAVVFGENAFGWAVANEVEMRTSGNQDYGRLHGIAWYAIWGFDLIEEQNIFHILTA